MADDGAAAFAERFCRRLDTLEPPDARAEAQRETLRDGRYRSPYHWATYRVSGGRRQPVN